MSWYDTAAMVASIIPIRIVVASNNPIIITILPNTNLLRLALSKTLYHPITIRNIKLQCWSMSLTTYQ